ncbi:MAG TPA: adenylate/guanylate cyclase domain-containing protein [Planctomycetota bacterium]|jgi:adenylate cyclase
MAGSAELIVTHPNGTTMSFALKERSIIGRHPECNVILSDPMSSRRHCKIERTPAGMYVVEDTGSANGTTLNSEPLRANVPVPLRNGDVIQIGTTTLKLHADEGSRVPAAAPSVKLDDEEVPVSLVQKADVGVVTEEEQSSQDVETLKRVAERLKLLIEMGSLGASLDLPKLMGSCLEKLFQVFPQADRGLIVVYAPDGSLPPLVSTTEAELGSALSQRKAGMSLQRLRTVGTTTAQTELKLSRTVLNRVRTKEACLIEKSGSMSLIDISSVMCAPMLTGDHDLGLLYLETRKVSQAFNEQDLSVMRALAGQIGMVIRNSDLAREAAAQAAHRESLSRFLSPQLVEQMLKGKLSVELGGTEKKGTIFFSDIVGFTKLAAKMKAENVVTLLNRYFTVMQNIIFNRGGSIDKCAGDQIMAHWGVVGDEKDFTAAAITAAVEMQIALFMFNRDETQKKEIVLPSTPLGHGIGLNTGVVCAGNIGSDRKIEFTVIGDAVNKSARIEAMAGRYQTFLGEPAYEEIKHLAFCFKMPDCPAKNVEKPLSVYSLRGIIPGMSGNAPHESPGAMGGGVRTAVCIEEALFAMPCVLTAGEEKVEAMVTRIVPDGGSGAKIVLQAERSLKSGDAVTLVWNVPEKSSLPEIHGEVERCWHDTGKTPTIETQYAVPLADMLKGSVTKGGTAIMSASLPHGMLVLSVKELPQAIAAFGPGVLIPSDLKSHEEMVRV